METEIETEEDFDIGDDEVGADDDFGSNISDDE